MTDQYKEVDERLDNLIDNDYWSYGEDERSMIFTTKKIKDLFHSELEKVRQETREKYLFTISEARRGLACELLTFMKNLSPKFSDEVVAPWNRQKTIAFQRGFEQVVKRVEEFLITPTIKH